MYGRKDESKYPLASSILLALKDDWINVLLPEVTVKVLDFHESWKYPETPLIGSRLSTILRSRGCYLDKFYGMSFQFLFLKMQGLIKNLYKECKQTSK